MLATRQASMDAPSIKPRGDIIEDSSGSGTDTTSRKRFQRGNLGENEDPLHRSGQGMALHFGRSVGPQNDQKSAAGTRRRSTLRETKQPLLGPRPLESKRVISDSHYSQPTSNFLRRSSPVRPLPTGPIPNMPPPHQSQRGNNPYQLPFIQSQQQRKTVTHQSSADFLPSVSFDAMHESLTGLNDYNNHSTPSVNSLGMAGPSKPQIPVPVPLPETKISRSESLVRRFSNARKPVPSSHVRVDSSNMPPPAAPGYKNRRQSTLTSSLAQSTGPQPPQARQPRKSVGPGYFAQSTSAIRSTSRDTRILPSQSQPSLIRSNSITRASPPNLSYIPSRPGTLAPGQPVPPRNTRTKSLQPPPRGQSHGNLLFAAGATPDHVDNQVSPRPRNQRSQTPSSGNNGNNRLSTLYVGGLGARTISPTDARRMRRLSAVPKQPMVPQLPTQSQPDLILPTRITTQSPPPVIGKTSTPSSTRNTPDFSSRKHVNSVQSVSSNSSINSLRLSVNVPPRASQVIAASRLPAPKSRNVHSSTGFVQEDVPPVPAIPKAYESPKDQHHSDPSYFARKAIQQDFEEHVASRGPIKPTAPPPAIPNQDFNSDLRQIGNPRHRRGMTVGSGQEPDKPMAVPNLSKKNLQPLRLPPLNLLPLGAPTTNRMPVLAPMNDQGYPEATTPPPKRMVTKTPSTPMTASKATFFGRDEEDGLAGFQSFRSSSSHHPVRPDGFDIRDPLGLSAPIPVPGSRNNASPFSSNSLPKLTEFGPFSTSNDNSPTAATPVDQISQSQPFLKGVEMNAVNLPSPKAVQQLSQPNPSARTSSSDEPGTPASTSSLRRKLSLTWKRSSSKASQRAQAAAQAEKEKEENRIMQSEMPPPKIPASATWSTRNSSDTGSSRPSFDTKTRKPSNGVHDIKTQPASNPVEQKSNTAQPPPYAELRKPTPRSSSSSLLTPVQRMLGGKGSINTLRSRHLDTNLDKDDLAADKIMEKLASRRKDFEHAAKEVDELRKRAHPKERLSSSQAIQMVNLNIFERGEIIDYSEVYFCGTRNAKKIVGKADHASTNFGYDDDRGDYNIVFGDHLAYRYEVVDLLGKGSFGQVVRCIDHKTGVLVAIKIIRNKKRFHQQALVEVNILQKLREWDPENKHSMINFTQSFYFRGHLCISTELLGINLYEFIKAYEFRGFPLMLIRRFTKQILSSLMLLKGKRVIHCDLKPENILLAHPLHSEIKVIDFGSSCFENEKVYTYIQSRFYRSPEVILGMSYGIPIDMWSLGCILAELFSGYPIFPGENEQEQLACIMEIFGPPEKHLIEKSSRKKLFFDSMGKPRVTVSSKGRRRRPSSKTLQSALKCDDEAFIDFLTTCLRWDPDKRLKPEQALQHEFVTGIKRAPLTTARPIPRVPVNPPASGQNSPARRFNAPNPTPQRAHGSRDISATIRPLPEPPAPGFRNPSVGSASPVKGSQGSRRHSTMTAAPVPGSIPSGPGKRVHTTGALSSINAQSGLASVVASTRNGNPGPQQRVASNRNPVPSATNGTSGATDLASAAAAVSLRNGR